MSKIRVFKKLSEVDAKEFYQLLKIDKVMRGKDLAKLIGVGVASISGWHKNKCYPAYCKAVLELIKLRNRKDV